MWAIPNVTEKLKQFDDVITEGFLRATAGGINCLNIKGKLIALLPKLDRFRKTTFSESRDIGYEFSTMLWKDRNENSNPAMTISFE